MVSPSTPGLPLFPRTRTHRPQKDRTAFPARDRPVSGHPTGPGAVARQHRRECVGPPPRELSSPRRRAPRWRSRRPPRPVRNRMSPSPSGTGHRTPVTEPQRHSPRSATGGAGGRAAGEAMPLPRQRSVVGRWTGGRSAARPVGRRHAQAPRAGQRPAAPIDATTAVAAGRDAPRPTAGCGSRRRDSCPHLCQVCGRLGCYLPGIGRGASAVLPHSNAPLPWSSMAGSRRPRDRARVAPRPVRVRAYRRR